MTPVDEGSVTRAAQRLDVTQSAVRHLLDKLRAIVGDPMHRWLRRVREAMLPAMLQAVANLE